MGREKLFNLAVENCASSRKEVAAFIALSEEKKMGELRTSGEKIFAAFTHIYNCVGFGAKKVYAPCTELWFETKNCPSKTVQKIRRKIASPVPI